MTQPWIWALLIGLNGLFAWGVIQQLILGQPWGSQPAPDILLVFFGLIPLFFLVGLITMNMKTNISKNEIEVDYFPFLKKKINWSEVKSAQVRKYSPLREYGGWGIRFGLGGRGTAYNVRGKYGLQLLFKDGKKLLIGTQSPDQLQLALKQVESLKTKPA